ncbi:MAG: hypothetical protein ACYDH3_10960 [Candidatus Aminicenantales bacterium]
MRYSAKGWMTAIAVLTILVGGTQVGCKSPSNPTNPDSKVFTSASTQGHTHTITIQKSEIDNPPAGGISRETSANGHTHTFTMSQAELTDVKNGTAVTVTTADTNGHHHEFTIQKWY